VLPRIHTTLKNELQDKGFEGKLIKMNYKKYTRASLLADSLSLATHWIYNQSKIQREFPDGIYKLSAPKSQYHGTKKEGDLTHYGDQAVWLADGASKETLSSEGKGISNSNELAGAARIGVLLDQDVDLKSAIESARSQTTLTHGDPAVADAAEFFVRAVKYVEKGKTFNVALQEAVDEGVYNALPVKEHLEKVRSMDASAYLKVGQELGLTCHIPEAFPLALYFLIHHGERFDDCISKNSLTGGDTSARAMLLGMMFAARDGDVNGVLYNQLNLVGAIIHKKQLKEYSAGSHKVEITSPHGKLSGILEYPDGELKAVALFAHCFTCGKDFLPEVQITKALAKLGIATLRVDFAGVGKSEGDFAATSFLTNLEDLYASSEWLSENLACPSMIIGHSLGGAAAYAVASEVCGIKAVISIGAPADPAHVVHLFEDHVEEINREGVAEVPLAGRKFRIGKKFIDDIKSYDYKAKLNALTGHKLVMHAPDDDTVSLKNAGEIYSELQHPKSFIALEGANHLLTDKKDSEYVANIISVWAERAWSLVVK